jgi:uncharacterized protein
MPQVLDPVWIPLTDGCRLAARVWLPDDAERRPSPVILEAIPYRRTDGTLTVDHPRFDFWARRGFAGVRIDIRGSGDSDGVLTDEYLPQEQADACEVIAWLAARPWCSGRVGMIGYSWGGFAGLQVAGRRPPELGAVVTVNSAVRRYTDDCHYVGGCVNAYDMLSWATTMLAFDSRPPDPAIVGDRWREMWAQRLEVSPPMIERWLSHQLEDDYWRHGSVAFSYESIACPLLAVGGWADPYRNAVLELLANARSAAFGVIGPWAHGYPHATAPGPMIGFLSECERFFGRYLRDDDNGYDSTPRLRAYLQRFDPPTTSQQTRSGAWISIADWPPPDQRCERLALGDRTLRATPAERSPGELRIGSAQTNGLTAGSWCPYGTPSLPLDQRSDDVLSLCFDSEPLAGEVEMLGYPRLRLSVSADRARALVAARLCDVSPAGESLLVTRGILNLRHREGHDRPLELRPDEPVDLELRLDAAGHRFATGHRIRLALSPTYWPWIWPSPEPAVLTVEPSACELDLPLLGEHGGAELGIPEETETVAITQLTPRPLSHVVRRDPATEAVELVTEPDYLAGRYLLVDLGLETEDWGENVYRIRERDPLSAEVRCRRREVLCRPGWEVRVEAQATMRSTATEFLVDTALDAFEGDKLIASRRFETRVRRAD